MSKNNTLSLTPELRLTRGSLAWLIVASWVSISWHIPHTPVWALLAALLIGSWRYRLMIKGLDLPSKGIKFLLTVAAIIGVLVSYHSLLGRDPGMTFLIILASLKLLEIRTQRDFMFVVFLCYFLVMGNFLFDQTIPTLAFMVIAVIVVTAAVLRLTRQQEDVKVSHLLKTAGKFFLLSLPFAIVLFFLFPRTSGPLWNLPQESGGRYRSGFNDYMRPGQIARLARSSEPAFRVMFPDGNMPAPKFLYFRGVVLWFTDGQAWFQGLTVSPRYELMPVAGEKIRQDIVLEPHQRRWLFALDRPVEIPYWARLLPGMVFASRDNIKRHIRYEVVSHLGTQSPEPLPSMQHKWALQIPRGLNRQIKYLARSFREGANTDADIVQAGLDYFKNEGFVYTLDPGESDPLDPLGDFLFITRRGFCEHYAAAFTILMRVAGVPARVVAGYQGGVYNPVGDYLLVRQSEAHAWTEVWINGLGWQRVDPTTMVAPERIEYGSDISRSLGGEYGENRSEALKKALSKNFFKNLFQTLEYYWDTVNNKWNLWIMSYDMFQQRDFLEAIGLRDIDWLTMILMVAIISASLFFLVSLLVRRKRSSDQPLLFLYREFCRKLARAGMERQPWEGPLDFARRAAAAFPAQAEAIAHISNFFIDLRFYRTPLTSQRLKAFRRSISRFSARK